MNETAGAHDASHDFDFWFGRWRSENQRLLKRLQGCTEWETFTATSHAWPILGGMGNMDDFVPDGWRPGFIGMSLRLFDPRTQQWSIYWMSNHNQSGTLEPPVVGGFKDGVGVFECNDTFEGRPIRVRYVWSDITPVSARWHQDFSDDGGQSWETNWITRFTRIADDVSAESPNDCKPTQP
jgi:hypothetical protein